MKCAITNKSIVLGVSGGIAAYKSVELLRLMKKCNADVRIIMTRSACNFVGPMTFEALSGRAVWTDLFEGGTEAAIRHIDWAENADAVVIAPATANIIGKLANGIADDALSTFMLAVTRPVLICPSMNSNMFLSRPVQRNLKILEGDGCILLEPGAGELACGTSGPGRLPEPEIILDRLIACLTPSDLDGRKVLVTAGPTREHIDPVRYLSNPSSGKMGFAVARAAEQRGAEVTLVTGPTELPDPLNVNIIRVCTAGEMADAVWESMAQTDVIIKTAAVSDYCPREKFAQKIKKKEKSSVLELEQNPDILKEIGKRKTNQILVGFAAETEDLMKNAEKKLAAKNLDIIAANIVGPECGFGTDHNKVTLFFRNGQTESLPEMAKEEVAHQLLDRVVGLMV
jgi:phosphopantothenoylcysteine decarboxylase/phosphopantothenate--cysteine ligase